MQLTFRYILVAIFAVICFGAFAQIKINEVVSSNSFFMDEDGDTPDWIELRNFNSTSVSIDGWSITDDFDDPQKWIFINQNIDASGYSLLWASAKNRNGIGFPRTLINIGDTWKYIIPNQPLSINWKLLETDDQSWSEGDSGFGYGDDDDETILTNNTVSVFLRKKFLINDVESVEKLILDIDFDDGFVAYINGIEVARENVNGSPPSYSAFAAGNHEAKLYLNNEPDRYEIANLSAFLTEGENILAIQAHNVSNTSSDMTVIPFLTAVFNQSTSQGVEPPDFLNFSVSAPHTNFKISTEGETVYLFDNNGLFVDSLPTGKLRSDISVGLTLIGDQKAYFESPTPNAANTTQSFEGILDKKIIFSSQGGSINSVLNLVLSGNESNEVIRYTMDASIPASNSLLYSIPIFMNETRTIRARLYKAGYIPSATQSNTYLFDISHELPIVSIVTDPDNFFDGETGIYVLGNGYSGDFPYFGSNIWEEWERPINFSLYSSEGAKLISFDAGTKIFGGWSRANDQRSLSIFARSQYGVSEIDYPIFKNQPYSTYQSLVLRNSGNDWLRSNLRDRALTSLMEGDVLDFQDALPVAAYINGEYWGTYNIREKVNEHFLASKHNLDSEQIDLLEFDGIAVHGSDLDYQSMMQFIENNSLAIDENYQLIADQIDLENIATYYSTQIYFDNQDWPGNNIKFWRPTNGKWRWILYDTDFSFGTWNPNSFSYNTLDYALEANGPNWPNPPWSTLLFRRLCQNTSFRNIFVNKYADNLNTRFLPDAVEDHIEKCSDDIITEISGHLERWEGDFSFWNGQVNNMINFGHNRPFFAKLHILNSFDLLAFHEVTISNDTPEFGYVKLNSLTLEGSEWKGDYYLDVPINIKAIPRSGYEFLHWEGDSDSESATLTINMEEAKEFTPIFVLSNDPAKPIIINEINYESSPENNADDWIELYNPNAYEMDLSDWEVKDNDDSHSYIFPIASSIGGNDYMIITRNLFSFKNSYPDVDNIIGDFDYGLGSTVDAVRLYDQNNELIDIVEYSSSLPWPEEPNGTGHTLELISPELDNALPENWKSINENGSPGRFNQEVPTLITPKEENLSISIYPNPATDRVKISIGLSSLADCQINLLDINGKLIESLNMKNSKFYGSEIHYDLEYLRQGVYLIEVLSSQGTFEPQKLVKVN